MHRLPSGAWLLDTPGMRELQLAGCESGLAEVFADIAELADACREVGTVTVVAPDREQSGTSHSLTLHRPLRPARRPDGAWQIASRRPDKALKSEGYGWRSGKAMAVSAQAQPIAAAVSTRRGRTNTPRTPVTPAAASSGSHEV